LSAVESCVEQNLAPVITEQQRWTSLFGTSTKEAAEQDAPDRTRTNQQYARLMLVRNFIAQIGRAKFSDVLQTTLMELCPVIRAAAAYAFIADSDGRLQLQGRAAEKDAAGMEEENLPGIETKIAQRVFESERAWIEQYTCGVPIRSGENMQGVLAVLRSDSTFFNATEVEFLKQFATQIGAAITNTALHQENRQLKMQMTAETVAVELVSPEHSHFEELVGNSRALRRVLNDVDIVAPTGSTVLIHGETGTGKELIAHAIHYLSPREEKNFVKLNCAAIPTGLLESELFSHERGAFTGALTQRLGRFEVADGGTIFLDEVGEIPLELQTKLLRVLQEKEFERLGSTRTIRVDTRPIAATNRNLSDMVADRKFRSDLFYRLNVFPIRIPALRERAEDIPLLVRHFVSRCNRKMDKAIDTILPETMTALTAYSWPGNIRELANLIERAAIRTRGTALDLPLRELQNRPLPWTSKEKAQSLEEAERAHILAALRQTKWVIAGPNGAAALLGINRSTLQHRMDKLGIVKPGKWFAVTAVTDRRRPPPLQRNLSRVDLQTPVTPDECIS